MSDSRKGCPISYCDEFNIWPHIRPSLETRLPLKNVDWKYSAGVGRIENRPLSTVPIHWCKYNTDMLSGGSGTGGNKTNVQLIQNVPQLHLYFINCDDVEVYKMIVKKQIQGWHEVVSTRKGHEWLIILISQDVHAPTAQSKAASGANNFLIKSSLLDKIKSDFNIGKKDRCAQLRLKDDTNSELWKDFLEKLTDGVQSSYNTISLQLQDEIRKMEVERKTPGFNYLNFFILKEAYAAILESLGLLDEGLIHYKELDVSFSDCIESYMSKGMIPWRQNFGGKDPLDDSTNVFITTKKAYLDMIVQNSIPIFDFRTYLFAREANLLIALKRPCELLQKTKTFVVSMARSIIIRQEELIHNFLESWVYSVSMDVVAFCETNVPSLSDANEAAKYEKLKGELTLDARRQLDKLGVEYGYLFPADPTAVNPSSITFISDKKVELTNKELQGALSSVEKFDRLYLSLSEKVSKSLFASSSSRVYRLTRSDIASVHYYRGCWKEALTIFLQLLKIDFSVQLKADDYTHPWTAVDIDMLMKTCRCFKELERYDEFLRSAGPLLLQHAFMTNAQIEYFLKLINEVAYKISPSQKVLVEFEGLVEIQIFPQALYDTDFFSYDDGRSLQARIQSPLGIEYTVDDVELVMIGKQGQDISYHASCVQDKNSLPIVPGSNMILLQCDRDVPPGSYVASQVILHIGSLQLSTFLLNPSKEKQLFIVRESEGCLKVVLDAPLTFNYDLQHEQHTSPNAVQALTVRIYSRDNDFEENGKLDFGCTTGLIFQDREKVPTCLRRDRSDSTKDDPIKTVITDVEIINSQMTFPFPIPKNHVLEFEINVEDNDWANFSEASHHHSITTTFEYVNSIGNKRVAFTNHEVDVKPSLKFKHFVTYRGKKILLQVTVTNGRDDMPIRIVDFKSNLPKSLELVRELIPELNVILFPKQSTNLVYEFESTGTISDVDFGISVNYRPLEQEMYLGIRENLVRLTQKVEESGEDVNTSQSIGSLASLSSSFNVQRYLCFLTYFIFAHSMPCEVARLRVFNAFATFQTVKLVPPPFWMIKPMRENIVPDSDLIESIGHESDWWSSLERKILIELQRTSPNATETTKRKKRQKLVRFLTDLLLAFYEDSPMVNVPTCPFPPPKRRSASIKIPLYDILAEVELKPQVKRSQLIHVGDICPFILECQLYTHHGSIPDTSIAFTYQIESDMNWLCAGPVRQTVQVVNGKAAVTNLELVPIRSGRLMLPNLTLHDHPKSLTLIGGLNVTKSNTKSSGDVVKTKIVHRNVGRQVLAHPKTQSNTIFVPMDEDAIMQDLSQNDLTQLASARPSIVSDRMSSSVMSPHIPRSRSMLRPNLPPGLSFLQPASRASQKRLNETSPTTVVGGTSSFVERMQVGEKLSSLLKQSGLNFSKKKEAEK